MYKIQITEKAEQDLVENALYLKDVLHSEIAAHRLVDGFYQTIQKLIDFPESYPLVNNDLLKPEKIRFLQLNNFTIFFNIDMANKQVFILRFIYSRRNWKELLGDDFLTSTSS